MKRWGAGLALLLAGAAGAQVPVVPAPEAAKPAAPAPPPRVATVTPNAQRDVVIGAIDKRSGETRAFRGHPGDSFDFGTLHVIVRTCEVTPPWEQRLTGAFLLIDERPLRSGGGKRIYAGWMFAESPSLHPLEHPRYDIWVKSCAMRFPDTGPDTVVAGRSAAAGPKPASDSSAKKSAETGKADAN